MSIRSLTLRFLFLTGALAALPSCNPAPVLLMNLTGLPPDSTRVRLVVSQGTNAGTATFQRENGTNKWLPMDTMTPPPRDPGPGSLQLALELPRGVEGTVILKVNIEGPPPMMMGMAMGMPPIIAGACVKFEAHDGALNEIAVPLLASPPPCS